MKQKSAQRTIKTKEYLRYVFNAEELQDKGHELAEANRQLRVIDDELSRIKADFKSRTEAQAQQVNLLSEAITSGYEMRNIDCTVTFNQPKTGKKTITRNDDETIVRTLDMSPEEMQEQLDLDSESSV